MIEFLIIALLTALFTFLFVQRKLKQAKSQTIYEQIACFIPESKEKEKKPVDTRPIYRQRIIPSSNFEYGDPAEPVVLATPGARELPRLKTPHGKPIHRVLRHVGLQKGVMKTDTIKPIDRTNQAIKHVFTEKAEERRRAKRIEAEKTRAKVMREAQKNAKSEPSP